MKTANSHSKKNQSGAYFSLCRELRRKDENKPLYSQLFWLSADHKKNILQDKTDEF